MIARKSTPLPSLSPLPALLQEIDAFMLLDDEVCQADCSDSDCGSSASSNYSKEEGFEVEVWGFSEEESKDDIAVDAVSH